MLKQHQKKYYGSLLFIIVLILATAVVLQKSGSDGFGKGDLTGMIIRDDKLMGYEDTTSSASTTTPTEAQTTAETSSPSTTSTSAASTSTATQAQTTPQTFLNYDDTTQIIEVVWTGNQKGATQIIDKYQRVLIDNTIYAQHFKDDGTLENYYVNADGIIYIKTNGKLGTTEILDNSLNPNLNIFKEYTEIMKSPYNIPGSHQKLLEESEKQSTYKKAAQELGLGEDGDKVLAGEETAIENYLDTAGYENVEYDPTTGQYSGTIGDYEVSYVKDNLAVKLGNDGPVVYKDTSTIPATYRTADGKKVDADHLAEAKTAITGAQREVDKLETDVQKQEKICEKKDNDCKLTYGKGSDKHYVSATVRQEAYMNKIYEQQEAQVKGLISGWLNNWLDDILGGWSRGVPAGICAHIFGLEYYKQDGWTRVPMNSSANQLQLELIANSRTVIIEGEKEEITDSLFRYAYTIKLLANESVEWQTYMYNSCTAETSVEQFYDYGYLAPGAYFSFHYAGAGDVDMIFDCTTEDCLYDQACVAFTDGSAPTCVSLVHGAGFESPDAGSDYDCI